MGDAAVGTAAVTGTLGVGALAAGSAGVTVTVATGSMALAGGGAMATSFTLGAANFWNPVGWALLAVAAVCAIIYFWDEISGFFSTIWDWFTQMATIVYEWTANTAIPWIVDTATTIWDSVAVSTATAITTTQSWVDTKLKELVETIAKSLGPYNVYHIHINTPGDYNDYVRGSGYSEEYMPSGKIYKYGITMYTSVLRRYKQFRWIPKEAYIYENLKNGDFGVFEWYAFRVSLPVARSLENYLIGNYVMFNGGQFPPGNTGFY